MDLGELGCSERPQQSIKAATYGIIWIGIAVITEIRSPWCERDVVLVCVGAIRTTTSSVAMEPAFGDVFKGGILDRTKVL